MDKASTGQLSGQIGQLAAQIGNEHGWSEHTQKHIQDFLMSRREDLSALAQRIGYRAAEAAQQVWVLFLVPILAIFFLRDGGSFHEVLVALVQSRTQREFLAGCSPGPEPDARPIHSRPVDPGGAVAGGVHLSSWVRCEFPTR